MQETQEELCRCCGRQPAVTVEMLEQLSKIALPEQFVITDELRHTLPPEVVEGSEDSGTLEQMQEWTPARQNSLPAQVPPGVGVGFCSMCAREGCDGTAPCRVPSEQWLEIEQWMEQDLTMQRVLEEADDIERRWLAGEFGRNYEDQNTEEWVQITAAYWRRQVPSAKGPVISEAVHDTTHDRWIARVKFAEEPAPITVGNVTVHKSAGATIIDLDSLQEAQDVCEQWVAKMAVDGPFTVMDIRIGSETAGHDE